MIKCCGEHSPIFAVQGGRFNEGGKHPACHICIGEVIQWVWKHPRVHNDDIAKIMVEVRPISTLDSSS